ncbi:dihydroorotase [Candidatus Falkowbacteria bacterium]|nr:dihydroorotase [Candidatus Falkowbacteria bacterium]
MQDILLKGGRIIDPATNRDEVSDLLISNGIIISFGLDLKPAKGVKVINCDGKIVVPGLLDIHTHSRIPGQTDKEDVSTFTKAAIAGGFTRVVCMANTMPVIDSPEHFKISSFIKNRGLMNMLEVFQVSALTKNLDGRELVDLAGMKKVGIIAASDDGKAIQDPNILIAALKKCKELKLPVLIHAQDNIIPVYDSGSEYYYIFMVLKAAEKIGCPIHIQHVSCIESVKLIKIFKVRGLNVTCETCPHYFSLTKKDFERIGANAKMNPPLRSEKDREAIVEHLVNGTIDVIATDHAPHTVKEKKLPLIDAPFGVIGLETAIAVSFTWLKNILTVPQIIAKMTVNPAKILNMQEPTLKIGMHADITVIDLAKRKKVIPEKFYSKARNCPWAGKILQGWPIMTIKNGIIQMRNGKLLIDKSKPPTS